MSLSSPGTSKSAQVHTYSHAEVQGSRPQMGDNRWAHVPRGGFSQSYSKRATAPIPALWFLPMVREAAADLPFCSHWRRGPRGPSPSAPSSRHLTWGPIISPTRDTWASQSSGLCKFLGENSQARPLCHQ